MNIAVDECDVWWFGQLYTMLAAFADKPTNTISRIGGGRISIPEDQATELHIFRTTILAKYPDADELDVMRAVAEIDEILTKYSRGGETFDEWFWTNKAFMEHPDWGRIRELARAFLLR